MIYTFDKQQNIKRVINDNYLSAGNLKFKINSATTLEFSLPTNKPLNSDEKYIALPHPLDGEKFIFLRLTQSIVNEHTIDYTAYEYAYQELSSDGYIEDKRPSQQNASTLMGIALADSRWQLNNVNVEGTATTNFYYVNHLTAISQVVNLLGGEIVFYVQITGNQITGRYMDYLARQGEDTSKVFSNGSNLLSVTKQQQTDSIYTAILPRGKGVLVSDGGDNGPDGYGRRLTISDAVWSKANGNPLDKPSGQIILNDPTSNAEWGQISGNYRLLIKEYDDIDDVNVLINQAYKTLMSVNHPQIQYSASVSDVGGLSLGDTVIIMHRKNAMSYKTRVFEVNYDLVDDSNTTISLGDDLSENSITSTINSISSQSSITSSQTQWTINNINRQATTYGSSEPLNYKEGDVWFKILPNGETEIWRYSDGIWVRVIKPTTGQDISDAVDEAVAQAKQNTDTAIEQNNASQQEVMNDIAKSQADLAIKDGDFNNKAQDMADEALANAKANTATVAKETLDNANANINAAKESLTTDLQKEVSDRTTAVATLDSKAQGYADSAKQDAIAAATTADGTINKKIDETASSLTSKITQNKQDADGRITTAQSTATQALNEVETKVSQTEYNTKTSQLTTDVNSVTQTANQSKQDIVSIKQRDGDQDARMNTIESDASGTKQTVSNIQTKQGQQDVSITTLQTRADGIETNVSKTQTAINDLQQINQITNSEFTPDFAGWHSGNDHAIADETSDVSAGWYRAGGRYNNSTAIGNKLSVGVNGIHTDLIPVGAGQGLSGSAVGYSSSDYDGSTTLAVDFAYYDSSKKLISSNRSQTAVVKNWTKVVLQATTPDNTSYVSFAILTNGSNGINYYSQPMLVFSSTLGNYVKGSYNSNGAAAKAQLTADTARTELTNYKTDADGRITKAQSDVTQTAALVATKVSQSDYDKKTGQLSTDVSNAQQTANSAVTTIGSYKTSNDSRVSAAETKISQNTNDINLRATTSDLNAAKNDYTAKISQVNIKADGISQTVSTVQASINDLQQINQLPNTEFTPDFSGWHTGADQSVADETSLVGSGWYLASGRYGKSNAIGRIVSNTTGANSIHSDLIPTSAGQAVSAGISAYSSADYNGTVTVALDFAYYDSTKKLISTNRINSGVISSWQRVTATFTTPENTAYISFGIVSNGSTGRNYYSQPIMVFDTTVGGYESGEYSPISRFATQQITIDSITTSVSNNTNNLNSLTTRVQTAEGNISTATNNITNMQSTMTQTSNQITQEIADRKTGDNNTLQSSKDFTSSSITTSETGMKSLITQTSNSVIAQVNSINLINNSEFDNVTGTFSGWHMSTPWGASVTNQLTQQDYAYASVGSYLWPQASKMVSHNYSASTPRIYSDPVRILPNKKLSGSLTVANPASATTNIGLAIYVVAFDANQNQIGNIWAKNITAVSGAWTVYSFDGAVTPAGTVYVSMGFTWNNGMGYFGQPMLQVNNTYTGYTPNVAATSTVLSLFKDNWSIGISDNIGAITSGIVGNSDSMSLISKNIILDGSVVVTDSFFARGAYFQNLNAAAINTGTLNSNVFAANTIDVNALTGNVSNFIQSNWDGLYGSTRITANGMVISSTGSNTVQVGSFGMQLDGPNGRTVINNGNVFIHSSTKENIGYIGHLKNATWNNVDYLSITLNGYHTTNQGDSHWDGGSDFYGGDGIGFGITNNSGGVDYKLRWDSALIAGYFGEIQGWHSSDAFIFDNKTYHKGYADFSAGVTMSGAYPEGTRSLHTQGMDMSTGAHWFGFMDSDNNTGFGMDQTQDVLFYVKGQVYSLYTMLGKLGMR